MALVESKAREAEALAGGEAMEAEAYAKRAEEERKKPELEIRARN